MYRLSHGGAATPRFCGHRLAPAKAGGADADWRSEDQEIRMQDTSDQGIRESNRRVTVLPDDLIA